MKVTYNWLKDFVDIRITPQALAEKLTMAGLEVTSLSEHGGDFVFEIEITSNRPDWLSVVGVAREVAAITGKKIKRDTRTQGHKDTSKAKADGLKIQVENKKDCPLYIGTIINNVKVGPSPDWLKNRLESVGCRSINNIVDITNYVLFETGEPLHAFDLDKLMGHKDTRTQGHTAAIEVRRAKNLEKIVTIDGIERVLDPAILVIADAQKPVAIAGIMGGKDSEVTEGTRNILLEAAVFDPIIIRRGRRKIGIQSESSYRFERSVVPAVAEEAAMRAIGLIEKIAAGGTPRIKKTGGVPRKNKLVRFNITATEKFLGINIASSKVKTILTGLGFKVSLLSSGNFNVEVPPYRQDVSIARDLAEEIARIYGFERIMKTFPAVRPGIAGNRARDLVSLVKDVMVGLGSQEVITYSLISRDEWMAQDVDPKVAMIEVANPLSKEQEIVRPHLLSGILKCIALNLNRKQDYVNIFEVATAFLCRSGKINEELVLGVGICGLRSLLLGGGAIQDESGYLHLKGMLSTVFERLGIKEYSFNLTGEDRQVEIRIKQEKVGSLRQIEKKVLDKFTIKNKDVFFAEIILGKIFHSAVMQKKFRPLAMYPAVVRDISFVVKQEVKAEDLLGAIRQKGGALLEDAGIIDCYKGKQIPPGQKALTVSCVYRSSEGTLTESQINPIHDSVVAALAERFGVTLRA